ncbi:MAG: 4Fe-4S binding protein [Desulfarculaceae bacterium]|nr:4Fe-4S binding protein [Desulfarculaceae bacterium]MCF8046757.1 4Fe-4S binding protein [Desulfarculaceae bacterium]MCF8124535.1 4Fe-4S binding protein [Desulfarculaceae bacterium]
MNRIEIDNDFCKGCHLCIAVCPQEVLEISKVRSGKGYLVPRVARVDDCTGCLQCEMTCPDLSITVIHDKGKKEADHA